MNLARFFISRFVGYMFFQIVVVAALAVFASEVFEWVGLLVFIFGAIILVDLALYCRRNRCVCKPSERGE